MNCSVLWCQWFILRGCFKKAILCNSDCLLWVCFCGCHSLYYIYPEDLSGGISLQSQYQEIVMLYVNGGVKQTVLMTANVVFWMFFPKTHHHFNNLIYFWFVGAVLKQSLALLGSFPFPLSPLISVEVHRMVRIERQRKKTVVGQIFPSPDFILPNSETFTALGLDVVVPVS